MTLDAERRARLAAAKREIAVITGKRSVPLWVGKTPDAAIPKAVKLRIWTREGGRCWLSGKKILPGDAFDFDHKIALCNGGSHSEDNLFLALRDKHREKTAEDVAIRAKTDRQKAKHHGLWKSKSGREIPKHINPWGYRT